MDPTVPDLTTADWEELRRLKIQIDVRDYQGELLVCIGTFRDVTVAAGCKVFAHFYMPPQSNQILRSHLVYEDDFTQTLEEIIIRNMFRDESLMPETNPGLTHIVDPIIPVKFLARQYCRAAPNLQALGFAMLKHYRSGSCVTLNPVDTMRKIYAMRISERVTISPKRRRSNDDSTPAKRVSQGLFSSSNQIVGEVITIEDSESGKGAKSREIGLTPTSDLTTENELPYRLRSVSFAGKPKLVLVNSANTGPVSQSSRARQSTSVPVKRKSGAAGGVRTSKTAQSSGVSRIAPAKRTRALRTSNQKTPQMTVPDPLFQALQMGARGIAIPPNTPLTASPPANNSNGMSTVLRRHVDKANFVYTAHSAFEEACKRITDDGKILAQRDRGKIGRLLKKVMGDVSAALEDL